MRYSKTFTREIVSSMSGEIRNVLSASDTLEASTDIALAFNLDINQENSLAYEISVLLMGLTPANLFVKLVSENLHVTQDQAAKIATEVHTRVLSKIPEALLLAQEEYAHSKLAEAGSSALIAPVSVPEIAPEILPEVLPAEVAHDVPHVEPTPTVSEEPVPAVAPVPTVTDIETPEPVQTSAPAPTSAPVSMIQEKLTGTTNASEPIKASPYPKGVDPYRESIV
jgi:hypothetical protein